MSASEVMACPVVQPAVEPRGDTAVVDYYSEAGPDYEAWSTQFNMHFGLWAGPLNLLRRERMLDAMNAAVWGRLRLNEGPKLVVDLGCGLGATMRWATSHDPHAWVVGATIVDWQVAEARRMNRGHEGSSRLEVLCADYTHTNIPTASADGVYALEAACHATGRGKRGVVREAARLLRAGGRFVVADGFRTDGSTDLVGLRGIAYRALCRHWAIEQLADLAAFVAELEAAGFTNIEVEDVSWRVAPSVAHVPMVSLLFVWRMWRRRESIDGWRRSNVVASLLTMLLGLCRRNFSYCFVSAVKASSEGPALRAHRD